MLRPENEQEIRSIVAEHDQIIAVGNRTKRPLSRCGDATPISLAGMTGMIQYEPSEFTFTAHAGTRISEVTEELASRRQYLPFDPLLSQSGATLGGTVASGLSGPGRFRYGGVRDFLLGAKLLCGDGQWTNVGGKVVKNAAGFDIPKLLVGSLGRFGLISELTFKVFPKPPALLTVAIRCETDVDAVDRISKAAASRWELDAIEYRVNEKTIYLRLGGPEKVNNSIRQDIESKWGSDVSRLDAEVSANLWRSLGELSWIDGDDDSAHVIKIPTTPDQFLLLSGSFAEIQGIDMHLSVAGATTWLRCRGDACVSRVRDQLNTSRLTGLCVGGPSDSPWIGHRDVSSMESRIKEAMDPTHKFPSFDQVPMESF